MFATLEEMITTTLKLANFRLLGLPRTGKIHVFFASLSTGKKKLIQKAIEETMPLFLRKQKLEAKSMSELWTTFLSSELSRTRRKQKVC